MLQKQIRRLVQLSHCQVPSVLVRHCNYKNNEKKEEKVKYLIVRQGYTKSKSGYMSQGLNPRVAEPRLLMIRSLLTFKVFTGILKTT